METKLTEELFDLISTKTEGENKRGILKSLAEYNHIGQTARYLRK